MSTDNGGPAFPVAFVQGSDPHGADAASGNEGMTLLDWFAGQALVGLLSDTKRRGDFEAFASDAYYYAEAMLAEKRRREATCKDCLQVQDHSPDAGKMADLAAENRELVEALRRVQGLIQTTADHKAKTALSVISREVESAITKHQASRGSAKGGSNE